MAKGSSPKNAKMVQHTETSAACHIGRREDEGTTWLRKIIWKNKIQENLSVNTTLHGKRLKHFLMRPEKDKDGCFSTSIEHRAESTIQYSGQERNKRSRLERKTENHLYSQMPWSSTQKLQRSHTRMESVTPSALRRNRDKPTRNGLAGGTCQQWRAPNEPAEDPGLVPSTHTVAPNHL